MRYFTICFVGLYNEQNYGDPIIADCTEWLFTHNISGVGLRIKRVCLNVVNNQPNVFIRIITKLANFLINTKPRTITAEDYYRYFSKKIIGSDIIILVGGGLIKYNKVQSFALSLSELLKAANNQGIPVVLNSVGVEGFDGNNIRCLQIKKALHLPCVKSITTRDDIKTLFDKYYDGTPNVPCNMVCDPAVWVSEVYDIKKNMRSRIVGLGVIRGNVFTDYKIDFSETDLLQLYVGIYKELTLRGNKVELFTNGLSSDNCFAKKVKRSIEELYGNVDLAIPKSSKDLVTIISNYKSIIAARLHATIIAYSLEIPFVGLVWNKKMMFFGKNIGSENCFLGKQEFMAEKIVERLIGAEKKGYDARIRDKFKNSIVESVNDIQNKYIIK